MAQPNARREVQTWVFHDSDPTAPGPFRINREDAPEWNAKGYGVFQTVNYFVGPRKKINLRGINAWAIEMDEGTKEEQLELIKRGLRPTMVVETRRGYQVYFAAKDATVETWDAIVRDRLVPFYNADKRAKDLCRILRVPGFLHQKDPANPFLVKKVFEAPVAYTEREMLTFYPDVEGAKRAKKERARLKREIPQNAGFWDKVYALDCEMALERLSGSAHVGGETYSFQRNSTGTKNILVNGKSTSCWIDVEGRIGSADGGGPTIAQWLNWFHKDYRRVVEIIKEVFPECRESDQLTLLA